MASPTENYLNVVVPNFVSGQGHFVFKDQAPFRISVGYGFFADHGITPAMTLGHMLSHIIGNGDPPDDVADNDVSGDRRITDDRTAT